MKLVQAAASLALTGAGGSCRAGADFVVAVVIVLMGSSFSSWCRCHDDRTRARCHRSAGSGSWPPRGPLLVLSADPLSGVRLPVLGQARLEVVGHLVEQLAQVVQPVTPDPAGQGLLDLAQVRRAGVGALPPAVGVPHHLGPAV